MGLSLDTEVAELGLRLGINSNARDCTFQHHLMKSSEVEVSEFVVELIDVHGSGCDICVETRSGINNGREINMV